MFILLMFKDAFSLDVAHTIMYTPAYHCFHYILLEIRGFTLCRLVYVMIQVLLGCNLPGIYCTAAHTGLDFYCLPGGIMISPHLTHSLGKFSR